MVVDTNVFVSALISPSGNEAAVLLAIHRELIKPFFSAGILQEYAEVLARPKFRFPADEIAALLALLRDQKGLGVVNAAELLHQIALEI